MNSRRIVAITRWILAFGALAGIVLAYRHLLHVNPTTVALSLLLLILLLAAEWGLRYAVVISIAATACYNFFFLPPVGTFTIADPQNWLALFAFLVTAIIASRLSHRARKQAKEARSRQQELEILFRLSRELLQTENVATLVTSLPSAVASVTGARSGILYLLDGDKLYRAGTDEVSEIEIPHLRQLATTLSAVNSDVDEIQVPLRSGVRPRGLLLLRGVSISAKTSEAIGGLISISMDRAQALENVARGEAAKESERLRTLMIDSITHELRTPLTSIKGAATALLAGGVEKESSHELLTIIDEESDRLNHLVSEAVEMAQLDAQQVQMHFAAVSVLELVEQAEETCSWVEEQHPVKIDVPATLEINADPDYLKKVICNLLENAAKYSSPTMPITISAERRGDSIAVSIADRGIGIDPSEQSLIFERFYRARNHNEGTAGTGMGLAISRSIIEAHGGHIDVTSQPGQGSVFTFTMPAARAADSSTRHPLATSLSPRNPPA
jgi:two-component system, OmpR family, sensor histidine kinase KdpD